jgi:hypothetical protein
MVVPKCFTIKNPGCLCYFFVSLSFSEVVTNQSTDNSSIIKGGKKNDSSVPVINAVGGINCFNHLDNQFKEGNP